MTLERDVHKGLSGAQRIAVDVAPLSDPDDFELVAAVSGKKIAVLAYHLQASGTVSWSFASNATDITGPLLSGAAVPHECGFNPYGHCETAAGEALKINTTAGVGQTLRGHVFAVVKD